MDNLQNLHESSSGRVRLRSPSWDDMRFPATRVRQGALSKPDFDYTNVGLLFPQNDTSEKVYITEQMPHRWKSGTVIKPHVHFIQDSALTPVFKLDYRVYNNGSNVPVFTVGSTSLDCVFDYVSGELLQICRFPEIEMANLGTSAIFDFILYRDDNIVSGDVLMKTFDFHYQIDSFGSSYEYIK